MKFLLDENFPLPLYRRLREKGYDAEHIIELGQRGVPDVVLRVRLAAEELVFLTNDAEFENIPADFRSQVILVGLIFAASKSRRFRGASSCIASCRATTGGREAR